MEAPLPFHSPFLLTRRHCRPRRRVVRRGMNRAVVS